MGDENDARRELLERLSEELSLPVDEETTESVLRAYDRDLAEAESLVEPIPDRESVGRLADGKFNALLEVYDEPRTRPGAEGGLLDGVTVAVKDNVAVRDLTMSCALRDYSFVPSYDATAVERLLDEGAALVGKANMDGFAMGPGGFWSEFGAVTNPVAPDRISSGSSSGSAAAVAAGLVDAALGTDTGGSVRSPAACCGVVGMKPTHRLVPRYGLVELAPSTDVIGPIARDVETTARLAESMAGYDHRDPASSRQTPDSFVDGLDDPGDLTVGLVESALDLSTDAVTGAMEDLAGTLAEDGTVAVERVDLDFGDFDLMIRLVIGGEVGWLLRQSFVVRGMGSQYEQEWHAGLSDVPLNEHIASRVLPGAMVDATTDGRAYAAARKEVIGLTRRIDALLEEVDVLLTPTLRMLPPTPAALQDREDRLKFNVTRQFSLAGVPAVSVPFAEVDDLPVSAQVVAPAFEDGRALQVARLVERLSD